MLCPGIGRENQTRSATTWYSVMTAIRPSETGEAHVDHEVSVSIYFFFFAVYLNQGQRMVARNFHGIRTDRISEIGMEVLVQLVVAQHLLICSGAYCVTRPKQMIAQRFGKIYREIGGELRLSPRSSLSYYLYRNKGSDPQTFSRKRQWSGVVVSSVAR
jgi:hypothetical protein